MDYFNDADLRTFLSDSNTSPGNRTEVVETESSPSLGESPNNLRRTYKKYELNAFPVEADHRLKRGTIHAIELHNFKSYFGTVLIDNLASFNAIIGPNGAGKSNLMDAISFVLCIRTATLRGSNLRDLINKNPDSSDPVETRHAYVALTLKGDSELAVFKRAISSRGNISYIYNNNTITFKGYTEALHEFKINTLGSTGLIFQGSVNDIVARSPAELTKLFETISGSALYEKPYNFIKDKLANVRTDYKNAAARKKQLATELKQLRAMDASNRKHNQQLEDYNAAQLRVHACQLVALERKFRDAREEYAELTRDYQELVDKFEAATRAKNTLEERMTNLYYNQGKLNRQMQQKTQTLNNMRNAMVEFFGKKTHLESQIESLEAARAKANEDAQTLETAADDIKRARQELEADISKHADELDALDGESVLLRDSQMDEFKNYKREFQNMTSSLRVSTNLIRTSISQHKAENRAVTNRLKALEAQTEQVQANAARHTQLIDSMEAKLAEWREGVEVARATLKKLELDRAELGEARARLAAKREECDERIRALSAIKQEHSHVFKRSLTNNEMRRAVAGVHGEVLELFELAASAHRRAVLTALGNRAHTVVARDYDAIAECIQYLKDRRQGRRDFVALDALRADKAGARRAIAHLMRRVPKVNFAFAIDSIEFDPQYAGLFEYLVGDTVIVATLDDAEKVVAIRAHNRSDARNLAFNVVTQNGQLITRNRTIVIGSQVATKNSELEAEIAQLNRHAGRMAELEKELAAAASREKAMNEEAEAAATRIDRYKRMSEMTATKLEFVRRQREAVRTQQAELAGELGKLRRQATTLERALATLNAELERENKKLEAVKRDHFAPLSEKWGVADAYQIMASREESAEKLSRTLAQQRSTLARYDRDLADLAAKAAATKARLEQAAAELARHRAELDELKRANTDTFAHVENLQADVERDRTALEEFARDIAACNAEMKAAAAEPEGAHGPDGRLNVMERLAELRDEMKRLHAEAVALAETCKVKNLALEVRLGQAQPLGSPLGDPDYARLEFPELVDASRFGFPRNMDALERERAELAERLATLERALASSRAYNNLEGKLEATAAEAALVDREAEALRAQLAKLEGDFESIKRERSGLFLHCFHAVKETVGPIYRRLSALEGGAEGQAFLSLDEVSASLDVEPFNCNVRYNTMPPMKKFLDLSLQSGGEKALSSIALLLALHNYRQAPFVVLDEVDANLDSLKLRNLTQYLAESDSQVIIISLKDRLFSRAQRLIGVYRSHPGCGSRCLVLDLEAYERDPEDG